jgi:hypothetical protein
LSVDDGKITENLKHSVSSYIVAIFFFLHSEGAELNQRWLNGCRYEVCMPLPSKDEERKDLDGHINSRIT